MADARAQDTQCIELHNKAKVAIPDNVMACFNPEEGDELDITVKDGYIYMEPVAVYPQEVIDRWAKDAEEMDALDAMGKLKHYTDVEEMFRDIEAGVPDAI